MMQALPMDVDKDRISENIFCAAQEYAAHFYYQKARYADAILKMVVCGKTVRRQMLIIKRFEGIGEKRLNK